MVPAIYVLLIHLCLELNIATILSIPENTKNLTVTNSGLKCVEQQMRTSVFSQFGTISRIMSQKMLLNSYITTEIYKLSSQGSPNVIS